MAATLIARVVLVYKCLLYQTHHTRLLISVPEILIMYVIIIGGRQGRVPEPTQRAEIRHSAVTDSRHQITALDDRCKVR